MNHASGPNVSKENVAAAFTTKRLSLVFSSVEVISAQKLCQLAPGRLYRISAAANLTLGAATMALLTGATKSTIVFIMERVSLPVGKNILRALNHSGFSPKGD
jgi:hypothetical protein